MPLSLPIPVAERSEAWVCGRSLAGIAGSNPVGVWMSVSCVFCVCCQVEVSATSWSLVQSSPTECGVSECDREISIMRGPWPTRGLLGRGMFSQVYHDAHKDGLMSVSVPIERTSSRFVHQEAAVQPSALPQFDRCTGLMSPGGTLKPIVELATTLTGMMGIMPQRRYVKWGRCHNAGR